MKRKTIIQIAVVMLVVFTTIVLAYPTMFNSNETPLAEPVAPAITK